MLYNRKITTKKEFLDTNGASNLPSSKHKASVGSNKDKKEVVKKPLPTCRSTKPFSINASLLGLSMKNDCFQNKCHMANSMKSTPISRAILVALVLGIFPSTLAILIPPPFIPRLQLHRPFPYYNNPISGSGSLDDVSVPFGYRQQLRVENGDEDQLKNKNSRKFKEPQEHSRSKITPEKLHTKESVMESMLTNNDPLDETLFSGNGLEKKGSEQFRRNNENPSAYDSERASTIFDKPSFLPNVIPPEQEDIYNSYQHFNPGKYAENSPEWQMAMLHYLLDMKKHGHNVQEVSVDKPLKSLHQELTNVNKQPISQTNFEDERINLPVQQGFPNVGEDETLEMISAGSLNGEDPIICRLEPFNICYRFDDSGTLHPIGNRRPVRLIRVYK